MKIYKTLFLFILLVTSGNSYAQFDYFKNITKDSTGNAVGLQNKAIGLYSTAMGASTTASGMFSTAIGTDVIASGQYSLALGYGTGASGQYSSAFGLENTASGDASIAIGRGNSALGSNSLALGYFSFATKDYSVTLGSFTESNGIYAVSMGQSTKAGSYNSLAVGRFNVGGGNTDTWIATDPLFEIGNGTDDNARANALTVYKNGKFNISSLKGTGNRMVIADATGNLSTQAIPTGSDNLGNHTATQNINLNGKWLSGDATSKGIKVDADGKTTVSSTNTTTTLSLGTNVVSKKLALYDVADNWFGLGMVGGQLRLQVGNTGGKFSFFAGDNTEVMTVKGNGQVGVGATTIPTGYKLAVKGKVICEELRVKPSVQWPDYVFDKNYKLMSLKSLENYIEKNKRLPNMPSAEKVAKEGIQVAEMNAKLLQKVEELTIYILEISKENEALKARVKALESVQN